MTLPTYNQAEFFTNLPQEIIIDILSSLPVGSITTCKRVCKSWRDLIKSAEFLAIHHSKSTSSMSGLALTKDFESSHSFKIYDDIGENGCSTLSNFVFPTHQQDPSSTPRIKSSADGLLLLSNGLTNLFICNPITREYTKLPPLPVDLPSLANVGFGASKVTGQYKVVVFNAFKFKPCICSLETGLWRSINYIDKVCMGGNDHGTTLVNGNLHWLTCDPFFHYKNNDHRELISCFDLETEQFTSFPLPRRDYVGGSCMLSALEGRLCFCDNCSNHDNKIVIWMMSKYGDGNSWTKEFIVNTPSFHLAINFLFLHPLKVFRDSGDVLLGRAPSTASKLLFYSEKSRTIQDYDHLRVSGRYRQLTPSFLSLRTRGFRKIASF